MTLSTSDPGWAESQVSGSDGLRLLAGRIAGSHSSREVTVRVPARARPAAAGPTGHEADSCPAARVAGASHGHGDRDWVSLPVSRAGPAGCQ